MLGWVRSTSYRVFTRIPIIGQLREKCSRQNLCDALYETASFMFFATMPLWVLPIFSYWIFSSNRTVVDQAISLAGDGELFVYSAASLGPLFYIITKRYGEWNATALHKLTISFPSGISFILFSFIVCLLSGFFFGVVRIPELKSTKLPIDELRIIWTSVAMFTIALVCLFCASAYRNSIEEFVRTAKMNDDDEFSSKWREARDAG